jgi:hypothetical protein
MSTCASATTELGESYAISAKALFHLSLGQRPRNPIAHIQKALKARLNPVGDFSIPNIPLVEINAVPAKQPTVFLLKRACAMVLLLRLDVLHQGIQLTRSYRKGAITTLPEKTAIASVERFDPFRRGFLYLFDELSLRNSSRQCRDNVNVIGNTSDVHEFGTETAADCR